MQWPLVRVNSADFFVVQKFWPIDGGAGDIVGEGNVIVDGDFVVGFSGSWVDEIVGGGNVIVGGGDFFVGLDSFCWVGEILFGGGDFFACLDIFCWVGEIFFGGSFIIFGGSDVNFFGAFVVGGAGVRGFRRCCTASSEDGAFIMKYFV